MRDHSEYKYQDNPNCHSFSYARFLISPVEATFICDYLNKLYNKEHSSDKLNIVQIRAIPSINSIVACKPTVSYNESTGFYIFEDAIIMMSAEYCNGEYEISVVKQTNSDCNINVVEDQYFFNVIGNTVESSRAKELLMFIVTESQRNSVFRNKTITFNLMGAEYDANKFLTYFDIVDPDAISLDDIYIPKLKKEQFERFIFSVKRFNEDKINLRYLLSGPPGTGKTQLMKAVLRELHNEITIIIAQGGSFPVSSIFDFCKLFYPCILIIDDVDFLIGSREAYFTHSLGTFLQFLDGFLPNSVFLIASTNDKRLVDEAASRPGRFDVIIDIGEIDPQNYRDLISRETADPEIINLFSSSVLDELKIKKVTGAFIVSLIKQLKSMKKMKGEISENDFRSYMDIIYRGFYSNNNDNYSSAMGF